MTFLNLENYFYEKYLNNLTNHKKVFHSLIFTLSKTVKSSIDLISKRNQEVDFNFKKLEKLFVKYLNKKIPLAYLINKATFLNHDFYINNSVLIPRIESELVFKYFVEAIKNIIKPVDIILDLCTGSGIFAISLAKIFNNEIYGSDISSKALKVANQNLKTYKLKNVSFMKANFLKVLEKIAIPVDFVICNPPYIGYNDSNVQDSVKKYEPKKALFSKENGLYYYQIFFNEIKTNTLFYPKICVFEIGHQQAKPILKLFNGLEKKYAISFFKDDNGMDRWFSLTRK